MGEHRTMRSAHVLREAPATISRHFGVDAVPHFDRRQEMRPATSVPIVRWVSDPDGWAAASPPRECILAHWGLVPPSSRDMRFGLRCITARSETVERLPAFRTAYRQRRCLVPVNAYFEFGGERAGAARWRIELADGGLFALAGLWEAWRDPATAAVIESFAIVTCRANADVAGIRGRMPVIVAPPDHDAWLDPRVNPRGLLVPFAGGALRVARDDAVEAMPRPALPSTRFGLVDLLAVVAA
ncbi:MAG TPA: SOS response-associated peptidase [Burkholderiaceae bacterium]|nr:SOS response-associated peptidase [Burkholderiaceae bacterium]